MMHIKLNTYDVECCRAMTKLSPEDFERLMDMVHPEPGTVKPQQVDFELGPDRPRPYLSGFLVSQVEMQWLLGLGLPLEVKRLRGQLVLEEHARADPGQPPGSTLTQYICNGGVGLLEIKRVHYEENACTDRIQKFLDAGWRLLSVCPPNDARRPTYILGHHDPDARYQSI